MLSRELVRALLFAPIKGNVVLYNKRAAMPCMSFAVRPWTFFVLYSLSFKQEEKKTAGKKQKLLRMMLLRILLD